MKNNQGLQNGNLNLTDDERLKKPFKQAIIEAMEDLAMIQTVQEGEDTEPVGPNKVFEILEDDA